MRVQSPPGTRARQEEPAAWLGVVGRMSASGGRGAAAAAGEGGRATGTPVPWAPWRHARTTWHRNRACSACATCTRNRTARCRGSACGPRALAAAPGAARAAGRTREQLRQDPPLQLRAAPLLRVGRASPRRQRPPQLLEERMVRRVRAPARPALPRARARLRLRLCLPLPARRVAARGRRRGRGRAPRSVLREPAPLAGLAPALLAKHRLAHAGGGRLPGLLPTPLPACPTARSLLRPRPLSAAVRRGSRAAQRGCRRERLDGLCRVGIPLFTRRRSW
jgi:hypothetical protein